MPMYGKTEIHVFRGRKAKENILSRDTYPVVAKSVFFNGKVLLLPSVVCFQVSSLLVENVP